MKKVKIFSEAVPNLPWEDRPSGSSEIIWRYSGNPIIKRNPASGVARIFNSAVLPYKGEFIALLRCDSTSLLPRVRVGHSKNGIDFTIEDEPIKLVDSNGKPVEVLAPQYDPRLIKIEDWYYGVWCEPLETKRRAPALGMCRTKDFKTFYRVPAPLLPPQRNGVLFPRKVNGEYLLLSRPSDLGHTPFGDIFLSRSKDMEYWGKHSCVLASPEVGPWGGLKIGAGPAPIETSEGWLLFYHGVTNTCSGYVYSFSACLLDREDPSKVLYNCCEHLFTPECDYEVAGFVNNVTFPCAAIPDPDTGRIAIYYGAADTLTGIAFTQIDLLVEFIKSHSTFVL